MTQEARNRINNHGLMRTSQEEGHVVRVDTNRETYSARKQSSKGRLIHFTWLHSAIFVVSFIFTAGVATLAVLLWVRPESLLAIVIVGIFLSLVFVTTFTVLRIVVLNSLLDEYFNEEEDFSNEHHLAKSITYGFVALALAFVLTGIMINVAAAVSPAAISQT